MKKTIMRNKKVDQIVFENTANRVHKANLDNVKYRKGGIRF